MTRRTRLIVTSWQPPNPRADRAKLYASLDKLGDAVRFKRCSPIRQGDEYRCLTCNRVWSTDEPKPECERD